MDTVIVFWQDEHLNEEAEWIFAQGGERIHVLRLKQKEDVNTALKQLTEKITFWVRAKENWRLFLIDNYQYQCIYYKKDSMSCSCSCCSGQCRVPACGKGRNPYAEYEKKEYSDYKEHREDLINILNSILNVRSEQFVRPKDVFVIAVRDGDFQCKHELYSLRTKKEYWKIADDFPIYCRYMSYDLHFINKEACRREIFWLYCVIILLVQSKIGMCQLMPRYAYIVEVEYSRDGYYVYLQEKIEQLNKRISRLKELEHQYEKRWAQREESIIKYPLVLRNKSNYINKLSKGKMSDEEWIKLRDELMRQLQRIHEPPENYAEEWDKLREIVNGEDGENGAIYKEDQDRYEKDILDMRYHSDTITIQWKNQSRKISEEVEELRKVCEGYEIAREYKMRKGQWFLYGGILLVLTLFCSYIAGDNNSGLISLKDKILFFVQKGIWAASYVAGTCLAYQIRYVWINYRINKSKINHMIERIQAYQMQMDEDRLSFLNKTRNTMLYWKREHNWRKNEMIREAKRKEIRGEINETNRLKNKINMLYGYEKEMVKNTKTSETVLKRHYMQVGSERVETEFIFIQKIRFLMRE